MRLGSWRALGSDNEDKGDDPTATDAGDGDGEWDGTGDDDGDGEGEGDSDAQGNNGSMAEPAD